MPAKPLKKYWGTFLFQATLHCKITQTDSIHTLSQSAVIKAGVDDCYSLRTPFILFDTRQVEKPANIAIIALLAVEL